MALGFFRRRQKMVLVIMVLLMFAFLLSSVIPSFFQPKPGKAVLGAVGDAEITVGMRNEASLKVDLLLLRHLRLGSFRPPRDGEAAFLSFVEMNPRPEERALAWLLLLEEARQMGVEVPDAEVTRLLNESGLTGQAYEEKIASLGRGDQSVSERKFREAVAEYVTVIEAYLATTPAPPPTLADVPQAPPSIRQMRHLCRQIDETVQVAVATFPAKDFAGEAPEPAPEDVEKHFREHNHLLPRDPTNKTEFGFGYRQPDRARVAWLLVAYDPVARAVRVPEEQMARYWREHRGELTREVDVTPAGTAPATAPADRRTERREVVIEDYAEAVPQIREALKPVVAEGAMVELIRRAQALVKEHTGAEDPYAEAVKAMLRPAGAILARKLPALPSMTATLKEAVEHVSKLSGVRVVFPLGTHGKLTLDPELEITLKKHAGPVALGEVLAQIREQSECPEITWVACDKLPGAIFPVEPVDLAPVAAGRTKLLRLEELRQHEVLGQAWTDPRAGQRLGEIVATARPFQGPEPTMPVLIEAGEDFRQAMYVAGDRPGRLLWRLLEAQPEHRPETLTDDVRGQVVEDLKVLAGFRLAREAAEKMLPKLPDGDLAELAKGDGRPFRETEPFARRQVQRWVGADLTLVGMLAYARYVARRPDQAPEQLQMLTSRIQQLIQGISMYRPDAPAFAPPWVLDVGDDLSAEPGALREANDTFVEQAFALAPATPGEAGDDRPAAVVGLPRLRKVLLIQRIGYDTPTEAEFREKIDKELKPILRARLRQQAIRDWFAADRIRRRLDYRPKGAAPVRPEVRKPGPETTPAGS